MLAPGTHERLGLALAVEVDSEQQLGRCFLAPEQHQE